MLISFEVQSQNLKSRTDLEIPECFSIKNPLIDQSKFLIYYFDSEEEFQIDTINNISKLDLNKDWFYIKTLFKSNEIGIIGFEEFFKLSDNLIRSVKISGIHPESKLFEVQNEIIAKDTIITYDPEDYSENWTILNYQKVIELKN